MAEGLGLKEPLLASWAEVCREHPELGDEGAEVLRRWREVTLGEDRVTAGLWLAEYLAETGHLEEAEAEFQALLAGGQHLDVVRLEYGQFLESAGRHREAVAYYLKVFQEGEPGEPIWADLAAEHLKAMAERGEVVLDEATREAVERRLEGNSESNGSGGEVTSPPDGA